MSCGKRNEKIIVLGGSFNPPTLAHSILLRSALDALPADLGIYVPSSQAYVARKMRRAKELLVLSEEQRLHLLEAMCQEDERLAVSTCEFGDDGRGHSYDTMKRIQKEYPGSELYFLVGADKLKIIPRWHHREEFFRDFHFAVTARKGQTPEKTIRQHPVLRQYTDRFRIIPEPEKIEEISSTMLRKYLKNHDPAAQALVTPALWAAMEEVGITGTYKESISSGKW